MTKKTGPGFSSYRTTATIDAKIFQPGDQDGFYDGEPYIYDEDGEAQTGKFDLYMLCIDEDGNRSLIDIEAFNEMYSPHE